MSVVPLRKIIKEYIGGGWGKEAPDRDHVVPASVIRGTDLDAVQSGNTGQVPYRWHKASNARSRTLKPGDIVFEVSGGSKDQPVGRSLLLDATRLAQFQTAAIPASFCKKISPDQDKVHPRFLVAHLQLAWSDRRIVQWQVQSTGISNFNFEAFVDDFSIDLPPLPIQQRIAGILSAYDELIENSQRRIKILESMARALYREWFVNFRFPGHESVPRVPSPLGEIPKGWEVKVVKDILARYAAGTVYRDSEVKQEGAIAVIDQSTNELLGFHDNGADHTASPESPLAIFGDHTCKMQLLIEPFSIGPNVVPFAAGKGLPTSYVFYAVSSLVQTQEYKRHWSPLNAKEIVVADKMTAQRFASLIQPMLIEQATLRKVTRNLRRTRELLLPRLLSGQIDVEAMPE